MQFTFNPAKTLQAAAVVLRSHKRQMSVMRLLKILYIADRELLATTGRTLTGDRPVAMEHGPVLSRTYDYIKQEAAGATAWSPFIQKDGQSVSLAGEPPLGELTKGEVSKLNELCERYHNVTTWDLSLLTHGFTEWANVHDKSKPKTSVPIKWEDALEAQGKKAAIPEVERGIAASKALDAAFGSST